MQRNTIGIPIIAAAMFLLTACKVEIDTPNNSIYGTYFKDDASRGDWTDLFNGVRIFVRPAGASLIKITVPGLGLMFDSVHLAADKSFIIDEMAEDNASPSGYSKVTGHGSFGSKDISFIFTFHRDSPTGYSGDWIDGFSNLPKTGN